MILSIRFLNHSFLRLHSFNCVGKCSRVLPLCTFLQETIIPGKLETTANSSRPKLNDEQVNELLEGKHQIISDPVLFSVAENLVKQPGSFYLFSFDYLPVIQSSIVSNKCHVVAEGGDTSFFEYDKGLLLPLCRVRSRRNVFK